MESELSGAIESVGRSLKKKKKKLAEKKRKQMERAALGMSAVAVYDETPEEHGFFTLKAIDSKVLCLSSFSRLFLLYIF